MAAEIERINPAGLHGTPGYHHVTVVPAGRLAFLAGQCPLDASGNLVGAGDLEAQIDQVAENVTAALAAVGAGPECARPSTSSVAIVTSSEALGTG
jgi:enamine deaminase RidA (YjgF/YER057c/UK114 family)